MARRNKNLASGSPRTQQQPVTKPSLDPHTLLSRFESAHLGGPDAGLQERKSADTRLTILEAAMECIAKYGYARTTTQLICRIARISRGALLHHYPSKADLIKAVIEYASYRRLKAFTEMVAQMSAEERVQLNLGIKRSYEQLNSIVYQVLRELQMAARTDQTLRDIILPQARQYEQIWRDSVAPLYPEWSDRAQFDLGSRFTRSLLDGIKLNAEIWDNAEHEAVLVEFATQLLIMLRDGKLKFPKISTASVGKTSEPTRSQQPRADAVSYSSAARMRRA